MKKIGMFLAAAFVALASVSCNQSSDSNYATHAAYVRVEGISPVTYQTDEGLTLTQAASQVTMPTLSYGDRMLIYYSEYESQQSYGGKYITLYGYYLFEDADTAILTAGEENTNGEQPVEVYANGSQYYLVHCTKQVLDIALLFHGTAAKIAQHTFTLVLDEDRMGGSITLTEGKYHQIKRMLGAIDNRILSLERIRFASLTLSPELPRGAWRMLTEEQIDALLGEKA